MADKHAGGRPSFYDTPEELKEAIDTYFEDKQPELVVINDVVMKDSKGNPVWRHNPPTVAGLALHLGFADRQSIYDQKNRDKQFSCIIKKAVLAIEEYHESNLVTGQSPTGSIFWLKNHWWSDKQEIEHSGDVNVKVDLID